ncbi:MAG: alpha/beta hydrolase, partial [Bacteroidota bacterium]
TFKLLADTEYRYKRHALRYPNSYHWNTGRTKLAPVNSNYFTQIMQGSFANPALLASDDYIRCVNTYLDILSVGKYKFRHLEGAPLPRIDSRYDAIIELKAHPRIQDFFIKDHFKKCINNYRVEALTYSYGRSARDCSTKLLRQEIEEIYEQGYTRREEADTMILYRQIGSVKLFAHIFYPQTKIEKKKSAQLFFHGGGWAIGMPEWGYNAAKNAAKEGRVGICFDYRLRHVHGTGIREAVSDALTAVAWVREQAGLLGVDPQRLLADGFSAGAHLALSACMISNPEKFGVDSKYSTIPNAAILGSCPYDVSTRDAYDVTYDPKEISPLYLVKNNLPP